MQIRLTVVDPLGPPAEARGRAARCDVLVTAPAGTALSAVASALASAVTGESGGDRVVLFAGVERLDAQRCTLGEPPLVDGAVLAVGAPADPEPHPEVDDAPARLDVIAGPDAGGVHLLHGGQVTVGRSADADVPLDDPDVSRLHCAVTLAADGRVAVADLGSTNGTALDGRRVGTRAVRFAPGSLLRIGESTLRIAPPGGLHTRMPTEPDGEGHVRVGDGGDGGDQGAAASGTAGAAGTSGAARGARPSGASSAAVVPPPRDRPGPSAGAGWDSPGARHRTPEEPPVVPGQAGAPWRENRRDAHPGEQQGGQRGGRTGGHTGGQPGGHPEGQPGAARPGGLPGGHPGGHPGGPSGGSAGGHPEGHLFGRPGEGATHGAGLGATPGTGPGTGPGAAPGTGPGTASGTGGTPRSGAAGDDNEGASHAGTAGEGIAARSGGAGRKGTPLRGTDVPPGLRKRGGLSAWARRLAGGRGEPEPGHSEPHDDLYGTGDRQSREGHAHQGGHGGRVGHEGHEGSGSHRGHGGYDTRLGHEDHLGGGAAPADGWEGTPPVASGPAPETWPDPAALLLTALGPGPRLWERSPGHPEALTVRLGTADRAAPDGRGLLPAVPVTADLREAGALGLAGPRPRLSGLARTVLAQLAALHSPDTLDIVLISADRARPVHERTAEWSWLGWLPHVRPRHGQDCRLLLAYDRDQAAARVEELLRRLDDTLTDPSVSHRYRPVTRATHQPSWATQDRDLQSRQDLQGRQGQQGRQERQGRLDGEDRDQAQDQAQAQAQAQTLTQDRGPHTILVVDGNPGGGPRLAEALARLATEGPRAGIHVLCLAETAASPTPPPTDPPFPPSPAGPAVPGIPQSPAAETFEAACEAVPLFRECGTVALLSGDVATALRLLRVASSGTGPGRRRGPVGQGALGAVDAVSPAWAERFARALAPLRPEGGGSERHARVSTPLPQVARLLDELGLARATPASLMARWADAADDRQAIGGRASAVLGAGPRGPVGADLVAEGPHLLIEGPSGSGRTELLRAVVASLAAAERPDRLGMILIDGRDGVGTGGAQGDGLRVCTDLPHVTTHLTVNDPLRMREFAQSLSAELKRRAELVGRTDFTGWHAGREVPGRIVAQRTADHGDASASGDLEAPPSATLRLRPAAARRRNEPAPPLPRLVVVVDDLDALVSPPLGSPGRPAAGSVVRALEAVAREGERLGVHLVCAAHPGGRTAETEPVRRAALRITLETPVPGPEEPAPGRGRLTAPDGRTTPFQSGRVTGRIPRTATLRPTVVPVEWERAGDPPTRRPVRELGNGPTDLALLASALERAARQISAPEVPSLL
ncbi:FHA domain-containing protein [Streptomyces sp. NPDC088789]|uniref:FHA domain-containing protein n=1 Tax=Streptomyces sp. NPDC088789 TaxID=3365899 RepID=UPI0038064EFE